MPSDLASEEHDEAFWRDFLTRGDGMERKLRGVLKRIPGAHRCKLCAAPFEGAGAPFMRMLGKRQSGQNPTMCSSCFDFMVRHHGGAEIDVTLVFADIRGSTAMAETMTPAAFRDRLDRFYRVATEVVFAHDGSVDKFIGDELMAMFYPLLSGNDHVAKAVAAAQALLVATGHEDAAGPWVPLGAGVHSGIAWVGAVGDASHTELTVVGDTVNVAARLAAAASAGEILLTSSAAATGGLPAGLPSTRLELKGKQAPIEVVSLRIGQVAAGQAVGGG